MLRHLHFFCVCVQLLCQTHLSVLGLSDSETRMLTCHLSMKPGCFLSGKQTKKASDINNDRSRLCVNRIIRQNVCLTKGTEELVEVTGLPFFWEGDIQDMVSFRLHCRNERKKESYIFQLVSVMNGFPFCKVNKKIIKS